MEKILKITNLTILINSTDNNIVVRSLNLDINLGSVHAIMGPNGSGKSSLAFTIMGCDDYKIESGDIEYFGSSIKELSPDKRAKEGIFLAFQDPCQIEGATVFTVLKELYMQKSKKLVTLAKFSEILFENMDLLKIDREFAYRDFNVGFSGGQKKKLEVLQILLLKPKFIILDELDSGLDIDSLKIVCEALLKLKKENPETTILIITHYNRILKYIKPDYVHIMQDAEFVKTGDFSLALEIENCGYENYGK